MVDGQEDLSFNPFFKALTQQFQPIYIEAEKNCYLICVPKAASCTGIQITKPFIETHILQPSPFFKGEYVSLNKKTVEIEENIIKTKTGFKNNRETKILFEELFYNKEYKSFRVVCIESPLEGGIQRDLSNSLELIKFPESRTYEDCKRFLEANPVNVVVLSKFADQINEFNRTYVLVKGYETHATKRTQAMCNSAAEALIIANPDFRALHRTDNPQLTELKQIVESYILGGLHWKLFRGLCSLCAAADEEIFKRTQQLKYITQSDLGIIPEFQCPKKEALEELELLDTYITPLDKLKSLQKVIELITKAIQQHAVADSTGSDTAITTDDLIPLITSVIIQAKLQHLQSNIYYMEYFIFSPIGRSSLGFTLVTFKAAVEFLKSDQIKTSISNTNMSSFSLSQTKQEPLVAPIYAPNTSSLKSSSSTEDFKSIGDNKKIQVEQAKQTLISPRQTQPTPTPDFLPLNPAKFQPPPAVISLKKDDELGDFLSSLKKESIDVSSRQHWT